MSYTVYENNNYAKIRSTPVLFVLLKSPGFTCLKVILPLLLIFRGLRMVWLPKKKKKAFKKFIMSWSHGAWQPHLVSLNILQPLHCECDSCDIQICNPNITVVVWSTVRKKAHPGLAYQFDYTLWLMTSSRFIRLVKLMLFHTTNSILISIKGTVFEMTFNPL